MGIYGLRRPDRSIQRMSLESRESGETLLVESNKDSEDIAFPNQVEIPGKDDIL